MGRLILLGVALALLLGASGPEAPPGGPVPPLYEEAEVFVRAIAEAGGDPVRVPVSGLTVPHHLLAGDLIAQAFHRLRHQGYRRIILLAPDHFRRSATPFAVTRRDFQTVLGDLRTDQELVAALLTNPLVSESELFSEEHGVQALLPFVAHYFPEATVAAVAIRSQTGMAEWDSLARTLGPLLGPDTLLVQSTDFSHYLPRAAADVKDQETLRLLAGGDPEAAAALTQPEHLDCRGAHYLQLRLQREVFGARPTVMAHKNSQEYTAEPLKSTTSYLVIYYSREALPVPGARTWFFAGDTFFGRGIQQALASRTRREWLAQRLLALTRGAPLVVNLEGVMRRRCPPAPGPYTLCMETGLTLEFIKKLNIRVVGLANNHYRDYGEKGLKDMARRLTRQGLTVLLPGGVADLGRFRLAAFTDVDNHPEPRRECLEEADLEKLARLPRNKPLFALVHWGREFVAAPGDREELVAGRLRHYGVELILGSHPHQASGLTAGKTCVMAYSLGNFIFDQRRAEAGGALLEVNFFPSGRYFVRLHPLGNLYADLLKAAP